MVEVVATTVGEYRGFDPYSVEAAEEGDEEEGLEELSCASSVKCFSRDCRRSAAAAVLAGEGAAEAAFAAAPVD